MGDNGNGSSDWHTNDRGGCQACTTPAEVYRLGVQMLRLEADLVSGLATLRALDDRFRDHVVALGAEVSRLAGIVNDLAKTKG